MVTATFLTEDSYLGNINEPLTLNRYNYCVSSYLNYKDPSGNDGTLYYLNNIDGAKIFGHNAILIVDNSGLGTFYTYMTGEGTIVDAIQGKSVIGYMDKVELSKDEVEKFLSDGNITVSMAGGEANSDEYDQALYTIISDEQVEEAKKVAQEYIDIYQGYLETDNPKQYLKDVPKYNFYAFNCDTVASLIAQSIDSDFEVYTLEDALEITTRIPIAPIIGYSKGGYIDTISPIGFTIMAPNMSFLYSKELELEGWELLQIGKNTFYERSILEIWKGLKFSREVSCKLETFK